MWWSCGVTQVEHRKFSRPARKGDSEAASHLFPLYRAVFHFRPLKASNGKPWAVRAVETHISAVTTSNGYCFLKA